MRGSQGSLHAAIHLLSLLDGPTGGVLRQIATPFSPVVDRRVHLYQLAEAGASRPSAAMLVASPLSLPQTLGEQPASQGICGDLQAPFGEFLIRNFIVNFGSLLDGIRSLYRGKDTRPLGR